jgi:hypothetical protein
VSSALRPLERAVDLTAPVLARFGRPLRDALVIVGLLRAAYYFFGQNIQPWTFVGVDARAYWQVDLAHPYVNTAVVGISSYLYSPAIAQLLAPFGLLPFNIFFALWFSVSLAILIWLVRPWPWAAPMLLLPIVYELCVGNVNYLLAAAIVLGFRAPSLWAFPVLTKITLGVGALWFAVRREWRSLALVVGTITVVVAISFLLSPSAWLDWLAFLTTYSSRNELLPLRFAGAVVLVAIGALTGRPWLVPIAVWIGQPNVIINSWVLLLATIRLRHRVAPAPAGSGAPEAAPAAERA